MDFELSCFIFSLNGAPSPDFTQKVAEAGQRIEQALKALDLPYTLELRDTRAGTLITHSLSTGTPRD